MGRRCWSRREWAGDAGQEGNGPAMLVKKGNGPAMLVKKDDKPTKSLEFDKSFCRRLTSGSGLV
jgi:hypothetical protein